MYKDTLNGLWNEKELVTYSEIITILQIFNRKFNPPIKSLQQGGDTTVFPNTMSITTSFYPPVTKLYEGSIRYVKTKARIGKMEKVCVKDCINTKIRSKMYRDTLNGLWNADELISYNQAKQLAENYLNARIAVFN
jgi:hypothetical protein